jgi:hypothetical protein
MISGATLPTRRILSAALICVASAETGCSKKAQESDDLAIARPAPAARPKAAVATASSVLAVAAGSNQPTASPLAGANAPTVLAPADQDFVDSRRGNGWADRCYVHILNAKLDWAEAACQRGLKVGPLAWTEGAIWYNLGLIAEKRGELDRAAARYSKSLAVRATGNGVDTVQAALSRVIKAGGKLSQPVALEPIRVARASASTFIKNAGGKPGSAEQAVDGDVKTAWQSSAPDPVGQWLEFEFAANTVIEKAKISTGYDATSDKHGDLFELNAHARTISFIVDGQVVEARTVAFNEREIDVNLQRPVKTLRLRFDAVFPGTKWKNDLSISEAIFLRRAGGA